MPDAAVLDCFQLEAGGDETEISDVPALAAYLQLGAMDWKYKTEPQPGEKPLRNSIELGLATLVLAGQYTDSFGAASFIRMIGIRKLLNQPWRGQRRSRNISSSRL